MPMLAPIAVFWAMLFCGPAMAYNTSYNLPAAIGTGPFASCVFSTSSTYTCSGQVNIEGSDTVSVTSTTTLHLSNGLSTGYVSRIVENRGVALNIVVAGGSVSIGDSTITNADITVSGSGNISLAFAAVVNGNLATTTGNISLATSSIVNGNLSTTSGTVSTGYQSKLTGSINTTSGTISLGNASVTTGNVNSGSGSISLDYAGKLSGTVSTTTGNVNVGNSANITGGVSAPGGIVDIDYSGSIYGDVSAKVSTFDSSATVTGTCSVSACTQSCPYSTTQLCAAAPGVDHYELSLPSSSITCLPSTVIVTACSDATSPCTSAATTVSGKTANLATSGATLGATTLTFNAAGTATTTLSYPGATNATSVSVTLSGETTAATSARQCCTNGTSCTAANSCSTAFNTAGLFISASATGVAANLSAQTAGNSSSTYYLRAVRTGTSTAACTPALTGVTTVDWAYQCNNPSTCAASKLLSINADTATSVAGNANAAVTSYTAVPMTFDSSGAAPFTFNYSDAGQITLWAYKAVNSAPLTGSTNAFVSKPAGFTITELKQAASPQLSNPAASNAGGSKFVRAGESFSAKVTAVTSTGAVTPNYGKETTPEGVLLSPTLVLPSSGTVGAMSNANIAGAAFTNGVASVTNLAWSEVGILKLTPSVADGNYLGAGSVTGSESPNIGRIYPDHFTAVSGDFATDARARGYSYMGQPIGINLVLEARNASDAVTTNYSTTGGFAKLDPAVIAGWPSSALGTTGTTGSWGLGASGTPGLTGASKLDLSSRLAISGAPTGSWLAGQLSVAANLVFRRPTATTAPTSTSATAATTWGPLEALAIGYYPIDADGVSLAGSALNLDADASGSSERIRIGTSNVALRLGRLQLLNSYGSELLSPRVEMRAQYYGASGGWVTHTADSYTALVAGNMYASNALGALSSPLVVASVTSPLVSGVGTITFTKPSPAKTGSFDLALNLSASGTDTSCNANHGGTAANLTWLKDFGSTNCTSGATSWSRDPNARVTLGSPKQPYLYLRERY